MCKDAYDYEKADIDDWDEYEALQKQEEDCYTGSIWGIMCNIKDDSVSEVIKPMKVGSAITLRVHVTSVGELEGYTCDIMEVVE